MKPLSEQDIAANRAGTLTAYQLSGIRKKGVVNAIAGVCFLVFVPMGIFTANIKTGVLFYLWVLGGSLFALVFLWSAWGYLSTKAGGHEITTLSGKVELKNSGSKNVVLRINERSFFLRRQETAALQNGQEYTVYVLEKHRLPIGWSRNA